jgi:transcriptional regulator with XRE-family HTH domain
MIFQPFSEALAMPTTKKHQEEVFELGNAEFGARLSKLRKDAGITQAELARRLGLAQSLISRFEKGQRRMYDDMIVATAKILGVTPNDILGVGPCKPIKPEEASLTRKMVHRLKIIEGMPRRAQETVLDMLDLAIKGNPSKAS